MVIKGIIRQPRRCSGRFLSSSYIVAFDRILEHPYYGKTNTKQLLYDFALVKLL
jgi:hypothetical protein